MVIQVNGSEISPAAIANTNAVFFCGCVIVRSNWREILAA